jgi:diacylglycerol kinase family enzyme
MNNTPNTILFLVNPFAGKGNALLIAKNVVEIMKQNGYDTESVSYTHLTLPTKLL